MPVADAEGHVPFVTTHARILDRHGLRLLLGVDSGRAGPRGAGGVPQSRRRLRLVLEPDLRSAENQPGAVLHAFEVWAEAGPRVSPRAGQLCDWLASVTLRTVGCLSAGLRRLGAPP